MMIFSKHASKFEQSKLYNPHFNDSEKLYSTPEEFLESITQKINVHEAIYKCINVYQLGTSSSDDEYIVAVFEIMSSKLVSFYGGRYLLQMWGKKLKIFQSVHNSKPLNFYLTNQRFIYSLQGTEEECQYLYISNFFQSVFQKINHPFFSKNNPEGIIFFASLNMLPLGIHDRSLFIDIKQLVVINYDGSNASWCEVKLERILGKDPKNNQSASNKQNTSHSAMQTIQEEQEKEQNITHNTLTLDFEDIFSNCDSDENPDDIVRIHSISSEGYKRHEIHIVIESSTKIHVFKLEALKAIGGMQSFDIETIFEFEKSFAQIGVNEKIDSISLENYSDQENLLVVIKESGEVAVMSKNIHKLMVEYYNSIKAAQEEESSSEDEEELARIAAIEAERKKLFYRMTKICRGREEPLVPQKKVKTKDESLIGTQATPGQPLSIIRNFFSQQIKDVAFKVKSFFVRKQTIYFVSQSDEIKKANINTMKYYDVLIRANRLIQPLDVTMLQDVTYHLNTFNDFLIADTTLIISHQKIISFFDFLRNKWHHIMPSEQGNLEQQEVQTYYGVSSDEIESLLLTNIFPNSIYDCIVMYRGKFIRRLKYYNKQDKTFFEKIQMFENQKVLQIQRNVDTRNYRQYGDSTIRTLFMIEDEKLQIQQIWVSENGSRITKLVDKIPIDYEWQLIDIPNARSEMLITYCRKSKTINVYSIPNSKQCLYPQQLGKYEIHAISDIEYDTTAKIQQFLFIDNLYYQKNGNLFVKNLKDKRAPPIEINFNKSIKEFYMTHSESIYFKDKNNIFRFAQLKMQKEFNLSKQPSKVQNCRGAFCTKLEYSITTNRIAFFTSSFEISVLPLLDRNRIDLIASQDFQTNFVCWKQIDNNLIALKRPNILVTWNTDTGKIINYHEVEGFDLTKFKIHTEWNGTCLLKEMKEVKIQKQKTSAASPATNNVKGKVSVGGGIFGAVAKKGVSALLGNQSQDDDQVIDDQDDSDDQHDESFDFEKDDAEEKAEEEKFKLQSQENDHYYNLIEIISPTEIIKHADFFYKFEPGTFIYCSYPYVLVMDDLCTKMYLMQGQLTYKKLRRMQVFYEPQMKLGKPIYFSPNFHHRLFIDLNTKEIVLNFALTNTNIYKIDIRKKLLFQIPKTHPMIYFHSNDSLLYLTNMGVEKLFKIKAQVQTKRRQGTCELELISSIFYNEKQYVRRYILDPLNFNVQQASQMESEDILKFRGDIHKRNLLFNVYLNQNSDNKEFKIPRFFKDKNISTFTHFIIDNYRQQLTFSYLSWKIMDDLVRKKISLRELSQEFINELSFTVLPDFRNIYHILSQDYDVLDNFITFANNENIEEELQEFLEITDIPFIPNLLGKTPLHQSVEINNTRVTDRLVQALQITEFDHHSKFLLNIYPKLIEQVPQRMSTYLDSRLQMPPWIRDYNRGRIEPIESSDFNMTADQMWSENIDDSLQSKLYNPSALEVPLTMEILDMPHLHKYKNDVADEFLEALADTETIEIFSNNSIRALIELKWPLVKAGIKKYLFYPYLAFVLIFLYYTVSAFERYNQKEEAVTEAKATTGASINGESISLADLPTKDSWQDPKFWFDKEIFILKFLIQLFAIYFFLIELRQMFLAGFAKYLSSAWNYLDIIPLTLITFSMSFERLGFEPQYERPLNAISSFFMWIKFLYFWRIFRSTAKFIAMITAIIKDLQVFMGVFLITLTAFGNAMYIMSNNNPICDKACLAIPEKDREPGRFINSMLESVFFSYLMSLGDFDVANLGSVHFFLVILAFVLGTLFLTIMMLNILVAVISDSYARVEATSMEQVYKNFADLIAENEYLVKDQRLQEHDDMGDYLYIAKVDKNDDGEAEAWEGLLAEFKKNMNKRTEGIEGMLRTAQRNLLNTVITQKEMYMTVLKDINLKGDTKIQQLATKVGLLKSPEKRPQNDQKGADKGEPLQLNSSSLLKRMLNNAGQSDQSMRQRGMTKKGTVPLPTDQRQF